MTRMDERVSLHPVQFEDALAALLGRERLRAIACGGRKYRNVDVIWATLNAYPITELAHGGADGADAVAAHWAHLRGIPAQRFDADWAGPCREDCRPGHRRRRGRGGGDYCPAAGLYRNQAMLDEFRPDVVFAFPGGTGTADMISRSIAALGEDKVIRV